MTLSFQITRRDFVDACVAMSRKTRWFLFGFWLLLLAFTLWMSRDDLRYGSASQRVAALTPIAICAIIFCLIAWAGPYFRARRMILREVSWTFAEEGVHLESNVSKADLRWEAFLKYRETPKAFLLFVQKGMAQFIPKRVLSTEQTAELRALLASHIKAS